MSFKCLLYADDGTILSLGLTISTNVITMAISTNISAWVSHEDLNMLNRLLIASLNLLPAQSASSWSLAPLCTQPIRPNTGESSSPPLSMLSTHLIHQQGL